MNNNDRFPRWRTLCRNCREYGNARKRIVNLNEGWNDLIISASNIYGITKEENILLFIDSKAPRILGTEPRAGAEVNGSIFYVKYGEENLNLGSIRLFYNGKNVSLQGCGAGNNKNCSINLDLSEYGGDYIEYYFEIFDGQRAIQSRKTRVFVDTTKPALVVNSPTNNLVYNNKAIPFNISVSEKATLEYYDDSVLRPLWRKLCANCNEYGLKQRKTVSFREEGEHELTIRAIDKAGNSDEESLRINIDV